MIHDAETPLAEFADIIDDDVPLAEYEPDDYEELIIEEPDVPLSEMPATGLASIVDFLTPASLSAGRSKRKRTTKSKTGDGSVS